MNVLVQFRLAQMNAVHPARVTLDSEWQGRPLLALSLEETFPNADRCLKELKAHTSTTGKNILDPLTIRKGSDDSKNSRHKVGLLPLQNSGN